MYQPEPDTNLFVLEPFPHITGRLPEESQDTLGFLFPQQVKLQHALLVPRLIDSMHRRRYPQGARGHLITASFRKQQTYHFR